MKIRDLIAAGDRITAYCGVECGGKGDLDLEALGRKYGFDFDISHWSIAGNLRCTKCGKLGATIRHHQRYRTGIKFDTKGHLMK